MKGLSLEGNEQILVVGGPAMATRFEVALWGGARDHLQAAGDEAIEEIQRVEAQLSYYRDASEVRDINANAALEPVRLDRRVFRLLRHACRLSAETGGAFDITVAPLLRAWGFVGGAGRMASEEEVEAARACVGAGLLELDDQNGSVQFARPGMEIDLGAIGKGFAIDSVVELLREAGVGGALIHGGTSTIYALGGQPDGSPWPIALQHPADPEARLGVVPLRDAALSVSAVHGKSFTEGDTRYGHVLDPRVGRPVQGALMACVVTPSATESDALSTALLVLGEAGLPVVCDRPDTGALVVVPDGGGVRVAASGMSLQGTGAEA